MIGRRVLHGAHGAAGEIGYNMRSPGEDLAPGAGRRPLEEFIGGHGVATRVRQRFGPRASVPQVFASATAGDAEARSFVDEFVGEIAFHVTNLVIALDPEVVIFGGGFTASMDLILPGVRARTDRFAPFPPRLGLARFAQDGALRGAIALAIDPA